MMQFKFFQFGIPPKKKRQPNQMFVRQAKSWSAQISYHKNRKPKSGPSRNSLWAMEVQEDPMQALKGKIISQNEVKRWSWINGSPWICFRVFCQYDSCTVKKVTLLDMAGGYVKTCQKILDALVYHVNHTKVERWIHMKIVSFCHYDG